ncbi:outer membrane protein assembly factor BamE [bacterium]|nr:outer membrane protein assembly factor BamE [bacterium]
MRIIPTLLISLTLLTSGCGWIKFPGVHKVSIIQGNIVDQEMIDKLLPGMTKSQVQFVLGTPLIADSFAQQRWDYLYTRLSPIGEKTEERVTIYFDSNDNLLRMSGDYLPTAAEAEEV